MTSHSSPLAPCIVDVGTVANPRDITRLLSGLGRVRYQDFIDGSLQRQGEAYVMEVYADPTAATIVVNRTIYLNVCSFDYLNLDTQPSETSDPQALFDLVSDHRILRLMPLSDPLSDPIETLEDTQALKAAMADAIAAGWEPDEEDGHF